MVTCEDVLQKRISRLPSEHLALSNPGAQEGPEFLQTPKWYKQGPKGMCDYIPREEISSLYQLLKAFCDPTAAVLAGFLSG